MAVEATALATPNSTTSEIDQWALGRGLLQVCAAHEWLIAHEGESLADVRFVVRTSVGSADAQRGIYIREPHQLTGGQVSNQLRSLPSALALASAAPPAAPATAGQLLSQGEA